MEGVGEKNRERQSNNKGREKDPFVRSRRLSQPIRPLPRRVKNQISVFSPAPHGAIQTVR